MLNESVIVFDTPVRSSKKCGPCGVETTLCRSCVTPACLPPWYTDPQLTRSPRCWDSLVSPNPPRRGKLRPRRV